MDATLIAPSGKVLVLRARCGLQPGPRPLAMPVLLSLAVQPDRTVVAAAGDAACPGAHLQDTGRMLDQR